MKTLRYKSRGQDVYFLEEILSSLNYQIVVSNYFGKDTHNAVLDFQKTHKLVVDGIVGPKTWSKLIAAQNNLLLHLDKLLSEKDLINFADRYQLEVAAVKAVNEVESNGKGFLLDGRPRILFEGHIFWQQLINRNIDPADFLNTFTQNVLYPTWTRKHYLGGSKEYSRLEKAAGMSDLSQVHEAAYASASWGSFQIMGFHYESLNYASIDEFVSTMYISEAKHLDAFGRFLEFNNLIHPLRDKNWKVFARGYNGSSYAKNNYDTKLERAYLKFSNMI
ncbi:N-acetylmuramidase domain-containing protein [Aquimarina intermedia]|uniref:Peptidoglycan hydrolase-like protein with peptidoglycan-binding domain n=1 Tax=Aquimarina intermedia TaxID=350814 RepID=A0A5S5BYF9_9FLAO|nr:N-acetylmuramidase family protein [Aquimarina intermedia]TYP72191.1 peptidoglycan hydrolase-like protein with peptidoglycan-binding domain [Aquimarina intermedia]